MLKSLRVSSEESILPSYPPPPGLSPSRTSTSSSTSSELEPPVVNSNRRSSHASARSTSRWNLEELATMYTTGGLPLDVFTSLGPRELPPSDLSTESVLRAVDCAHGVKRHSLEASFGKAPMDRYLAGRDDPGLVSLLGGLPMPMHSFKLPMREKPPLRLPFTRGTLPRHPAAHSSAGNGPPETWWTKAQQRKADAQELLQAGRHLGGAASPPEKNDTPNSKIVQSANGKGQGSSGQSANPNSGSKAGSNAKKASGQTGGGKASNNNVPRGGGGGGASNGGNDPPKKGNGKGKKPTGVQGWAGYPCILCMFDATVDVRCLSERAVNASNICKHLDKVHDYTNDPLYLVEPEGQDPKHPTERRGLCKVCYEVFDRFKQLEDHIKDHKQMAKAEGKERVSADNQQTTPLKFVVMLALFGLRQSLPEVHAGYSVPFTKVGKAVTVKLEAQAPLGLNRAEDTVSSAAHGHTVHTPSGSVSGSSLKRSFPPPDETHTPARPQKQHKGSSQEVPPIAVPASLESSPKVPSLDASNGLSPSDSSMSTCIDPTLEHALSDGQKPPTTAPRVLHAGKLDTSASLIPTAQASPASVHASQNPQSSSHKDSPRTLPSADLSFYWNQDGLFWEFWTKKTFLIERPMFMPNKAVLLTDGTIVSWTGEKMTLADDGSFAKSYDPVYDFRSQYGQGDEQDAEYDGVLMRPSGVEAEAKKGEM